MSLFGDGRSEDRRRRVLTEDVISGTAKTTGRVAPEGATKTASNGKIARNRYGEAARMERQTRLTDLIPRSYGAMALWFVLGLAVIAGLEALYFYMPQLAEHTTDGRVAAFDLDSEGSLGVWYSSFLLQLASVAALIVYSIRKHRADDYHAHYRVWIAAALCWFVMSVDEAASLHEGFKEMMTMLTGERGFGDGSIWWVGAYCIVLGAVGLRLTLEMKECRTSTALLFAAGACYAVAVVTQLGFIMPESGARGVMLEEGLEMLGNLVLLLSMTVHARYALRAAKGEIAERTARPKKGKAAKTAAAGVAKPSGFGWFRKAKIDPPHSTPSPAGRASDLEPVTSGRPSATIRATTETYESGQRVRGVKKIAADFSEDDDDGPRDSRKPNKADRKNLRRQKDLERRYGSSDD